MSPTGRMTSLVAVREALSKSTSQNTSLFLSLMNNGKNHAYACKPSDRLLFGLKDSDFPGLGRKMSPFETNDLPSLEELQTLLLADLQAANQVPSSDESDVQPFPDAEDLGDPRLQLLNSLASPDHEIEGTVLSFPSPSLDEICGDSKVQYDDQLRESMTTATVLPRDTLLDLQHSNEGMTFTTLLSGAVAWFIWPPTNHNMDVLRNSYEVLKEGSDRTDMEVSSQLENGVCLVQNIGDGIRIPPFCPIICLSLETSILATYSIVTATQLADMLGKLPLLLAWFKTEVDGERKKQKFKSAFLPHLSAILEGKFEPSDLERFKYPYLKEGPLRSLLRRWDGIKDAVASALDPTEAEQIVLMWEQFLRKARGRQCWICGKHIKSKLKDMRNHFEAKHWVTEQAIAIAGDDVESQDTTERSSTPTAMLELSLHDAEVAEPQDGAAVERADEGATPSPPQDSIGTSDDMMEVDSR